jgi:hypothetical protein
MRRTNMFKGINRKILYIVVITTALLLALSSIAMAYVGTDQQDYTPGSTVTIYGDNSDGAGYLAGEGVAVHVEGPNGYEADCEATAVNDDNAAWSCTVTLWVSDQAIGNYNYTATSASGVSQSGTFTDAINIRSYASDCTTEDDSFTSGTIVCAKATGFPGGGGGSSGKIEWWAPGASTATRTTTFSGVSGNLTDSDAPTDCGTWTLKVYSPSNTFQDDDTFDVKNCGKQDQTITFGALTNKTYGDADFTVSATASSGLPVSFSASGNCTVSGSTVHITSAGSCTITASQAGDTTYNAAPDVSQSFNIAKAPVTMIAGSYSGTFDGSTHSPSACAVTGTYKGALTCTNNPTSVGPNVSSGVVAPVLVLNGEIETNFAITPVDGTYDITAAPVTITAGSYSGTYDGISHDISSCVVTADDPNTYKDSLTCSNSSTSVGPNVGSGTVTPSMNWGSELSTNYSVSYVNGSWKIDKAPVTMTAGSYSGTYDGISHDISSCVVTADDPNTYKDSLTCTNTPASVKNAGSGTVTPSMNWESELSTNYSVTSANGAWSIVKALLTVTADNKSIYFGFPDPIFTFQYSGFKGTDDASVIDTVPSCSVVGDHIAVGTYEIDCSGGLDNNYDFDYESGTLTVMAWTLTGFYQPVDMTPLGSTSKVWNTVKNGSTVPLKFNVYAGSMELTSTSVVDSFSLNLIPCSIGTDDPIETISTTGGTTLRYDPIAHQFINNWQTPKPAAGKCYSVTMTTKDGSYLVAYFKLK